MYRSVIMKLLAFTLGMIVIPIGSYFVTVDTVFNGKPSNPVNYRHCPPSRTTKSSQY
jgi:hypothetical protein